MEVIIMHFLKLFFVSFLLGTLDASIYHIPSPEGDLRVRATKNMQPWLGVLKVKGKSNVVDAITSTILLAKKWAVGSAKEIKKINEPKIINMTTVTFFIKNKFAWECFVLKYFIHPEFSLKTVNTLALIKLKSKFNASWPVWKPINWPKARFKREVNIYFLGFTDNNKRLEQNRYRMKLVDDKNCTKFYNAEGLNVTMFWPVHCLCFKSFYKSDTCINEAGMAAVAYKNKSLELVGISTYGPGCSMPSRFIEFFPYIKWIERYVKPPIPKSKQIIYSRRFGWDEGPVSEDNFEKQLYVMISNKSITVNSDISWNEMLLDGSKCGQDSRIIYSDYGSFSGTYSLYYAVTILDLVMDRITCISSKVLSRGRSAANLLIRKGFGEEVMEISKFVKKIPLNVDPFKPPEPDYEIYTLPVKYDTLDMLNNTEHYTMWFHFDVYANGELEVNYYAKLKKNYFYG